MEIKFIAEPECLAAWSELRDRKPVLETAVAQSAGLDCLQMHKQRLAPRLRTVLRAASRLWRTGLDQAPMSPYACNVMLTLNVDDLAGERVR